MIRIVCKLGWVVALSLAMAGRAATFDLATSTVLDIQAAMDAGTLTSERLTQLYLARIDAYDKKGPSLNAVLDLNPRALETARSLDEERRQRGPRSPLHGVPIVIKANIDIVDLPSTGGSLALKDSLAPDDAFTVARLREAGAIILAAVNLDEFARGGTGTSSLGGQTRNPYRLDRIPGGSSAGTGAGVSAVFAQGGLGTETGSSVRSPSNNNGLVGISPSEGLVSRDGVIPISLTLDRVGPMARNVTDAAALLSAVAGMDAADLVTLKAAGRKPAAGYMGCLDPNRLKGARLGVLRQLNGDGPADKPAMDLFEKALADLKKAGAVIVDPVAPATDLWTLLRDVNMSDDEYKWGLNAYLASRRGTVPVRTLSELIATGKYLGRLGARYTECDAKPRMELNPEYSAKVQGRAVAREVVTALMDRHGLDALVYPHRTQPIPTIEEAAPGGGSTSVSEPRARGSSARLSTVTGYPTVIVPCGYTPDGLPLGIEFTGRLYAEPTVIGLAFAYEQQTRHRKLPGSTPALPGENLAETPGTGPTVALFTTGGTIQSRGTHRQKLSEYSDSRVTPDELLADLPELKELVTIEVTEISNLGSGNMTTELLLRLAKGLNAALARPDVAGAVVTHGTGTLEETAYFLHLVVRSEKPVVVVGAMRPWSAISRDGPLNLYNAVRTAITPEAVGKGVLVVLDDTIHSARFVTKGNTTRVETFVSREIGPLGYADADRVVFYRAPMTRHTAKSEFDVSTLTNLPPVNVVYGHQEASPAPLESLVLAGAAGVVLADGSPAVTRAVLGAVARGVAVVQSDRKGSGRVLLSERQAGRGVVTADSLNPQKARMLLRVALTTTKEPRELQRIFNEY